MRLINALSHPMLVWLTKSLATGVVRGEVGVVSRPFLQEDSPCRMTDRRCRDVLFLSLHWSRFFQFLLCVVSFISLEDMFEVFYIMSTSPGEL